MGGEQSCLSPTKGQSGTLPSAVSPPRPVPPPAELPQIDGPGTFPIAKASSPKRLPGQRPGGATPTGNSGPLTPSGMAGEASPGPAHESPTGSTASGSGVVLRPGNESSDGVPTKSGQRRGSRRISTTGETLGSSPGIGSVGSPQDDKIAELLSMDAPLPGVGARPSGPARAVSEP